jgi:hypothetical protein
MLPCGELATSSSYVAGAAAVGVAQRGTLVNGSGRFVAPIAPVSMCM